MEEKNEENRNYNRDEEIYIEILEKMKNTWTYEELDWYFYHVLSPIAGSSIFNNFYFDYITKIVDILKEKRQFI